MKYLNKSRLMSTAWKFVRNNKAADMSSALMMSWFNEKQVDGLKANATSELNTWHNWTEQNREVIHGSRCVAQLKLYDPYTKNGTRIHSFFTIDQTCPLGSQD